MKVFSAFIFFILLLPGFGFAIESSDPLIGEQWYLDKIQAKMAWDVETGSKNVIVAVLDSGVDLDHPDLQANIWINTAEIAGNGIDDDGNGYIDDVNGWDFVQADNDSSPDVGPAADDEAAAHGSLVAGLIGAVGDNGEGVAGVAWNVSIMPLRTLNDTGSGSSTEVAEAIYYAIDMGVDIINLSFSGTDSDSLLEVAVEDAYSAGIVVIAAIGNENTDTDLTTVYPACYKSDTEDWVIGVTATTKEDTKAIFSNYGDDCADIAAPGVGIFGVSVDEPLQGFVEKYQGGWTGTSMSSPLVAGASALILSAYPNLSPADVRIALQLGVDPVQGPFRSEMGTGRLNVARALEVAAAMSASNSQKEVLVGTAFNELSPGDRFKLAGFSDVYVLTETMGRRVFIGDDVYFTYTDSFDDIVEIESTDLGLFPLEGLVLPKGGTVLVKIPSVATVYALELDPANPYEAKLQSIASEDIAIAIYGLAWADYVIDVDPSFFTHFGQGEDIDSPEPVDLSIMKTREELAALAL